MIIGLVSCSADKAEGVWPAHLKYTSTLFRKSLQVARLQCDEVYILSGLHYVVALDQLIGDYDAHLGRMLRDEQSRWRDTVRMDLRQLFSGVERIELRVFGSKDYADAAYSAATGQLGWTVKEPLAGLEIGQRLHALNEVLEPDFDFFTTPEGA